MGAAASPALAQTAANHPTDQPSTSQTKKPGKKGRHGKRRRMLTDAQLTTVATKLGTTLEALKAAQAGVEAAIDATPANETKAERDALAATALSVTVDQLRAAFASVRGTTDGKCKPAGFERRHLPGHACGVGRVLSGQPASGWGESDTRSSQPRWIAPTNRLGERL